MLWPEPSVLLHLLVVVVMSLMLICISHAGCFSQRIVSKGALASMLTRLALYPVTTSGLDMDSTAIASLGKVSDKSSTFVITSKNYIPVERKA